MAEQQEQEEVKRLVLNYNQRQEEEIYNGKLIKIQNGIMCKLSTVCALNDYRNDAIGLHVFTADTSSAFALSVNFEHKSKLREVYG